MNDDKNIKTIDGERIVDRYGNELIAPRFLPEKVSKERYIDAFKNVYGVDPTDEKVWSMPGLYFKDPEMYLRAKNLHETMKDSIENTIYLDKEK